MRTASFINLIVTVPLAALNLTPPTLIGVELPTTVRTATRWSQLFAAEYDTVMVESPNVSCGPPVTRTLRTTFPLVPLMVVLPGSATEIVFVAGRVLYEVVLPSHGSCASSIGASAWTPFGTPRT